LGIYAIRDPTYLDATTFPYEHIKNAYKNKFDFIQAKLLTVNKDDTIEIEDKNGTKRTIDYDYLVLCTGFNYNRPIRDGNALTIDQKR
jgi:NADH dehydrogenase FAD-containing subunit